MIKEQIKSKLTPEEQARLKELEKKHGQVNLSQAYQKLGQAKIALALSRTPTIVPRRAKAGKPDVNPELSDPVDEWNRHVFLLKKQG